MLASNWPPTKNGVVSDDAVSSDIDGAQLARLLEQLREAQGARHTGATVGVGGTLVTAPVMRELSFGRHVG